MRDFIIADPSSRSVDEARQWLTGNFSTVDEVKQWRGITGGKTQDAFLKDLRKVIGGLEFSDIQAQAILDLQLRRLSALERQKILDEYEQIIKLIAELENILQNENVLSRVVTEELLEVRRLFGDARRRRSWMPE